MKSPGHTLDPEVLAIVGEIVSDPDSVLLRELRKPLFGRWPNREAPLSAGTAFLNSAERHLLAAYRDELADALYQASRRRLNELPLGVTQLHPMRHSDLAHWQARAHSFLEHVPSDEELAEGRDALSQELTRGRLDTIELASASMKIAPSDGARIVLALANEQRGNPELARKILLDVLAHHPTEAYQANAHVNLAFVHFKTGPLDEASRHYAKAAELGAGAPAVAYWMTSSLLLGDREGALRAGIRLSEFSASWMLSECLVITRASRDAGFARPTSAGRALLPKIRDQLPDVARRIADVLV